MPMIAFSPVWWSWQKTTCSCSGRAEPFSLWGIANTLVTVATLLIPSRLLVEPGKVGWSEVLVGDEGALDRCSDLPVVPDGGVEGEQPLHDAGPQPGGDAAAVAFEPQLVLQRPDDRLDALPQPVREGPGLFVFAGRADQRQAQVRAGEELLGLLPGQALT